MGAWYESAVFWYCVITLVVGFVALVAVFRLGRLLSERSVLGSWKPSPELVDRILAYYQQVNFRTSLHRQLAEAN